MQTVAENSNVAQYSTKSVQKFHRASFVLFLAVTTAVRRWEASLRFFGAPVGVQLGVPRQDAHGAAAGAEEPRE